MPDDSAQTTHLTLRVPTDVAEAFERLAKILDRPRSWVMARALRRYLEDEAIELFEDTDALAELDRGGETVPAGEVLREMRGIIKTAERKRAKRR